MTNRIGIYPGTFNPVHQGHIAFATEALIRCDLDKIIFIPETSPRGKIHATPFNERIELLRKALKEIDNLEVAHIRSSPFTVKQTLPELQQLFPQTELTLLIGSDVIHTFSYRWEGLKELFDSMPLAIGLREGDTPDEIHKIISNHKQAYNIDIRNTLIHTPHAHLSSSAIRPSNISEK